SLRGPSTRGGASTMGDWLSSPHPRASTHAMPSHALTASLYHLAAFELAQGLELAFGVRIAVARSAIFRAEAISHAPNGFDERFVLDPELGAQAPDVHVDRAHAADIIAVPGACQQLLARERATRMRRQEAEQFELAARELQRAAAQTSLVAFE